MPLTACWLITLTLTGMMAAPSFAAWSITGSGHGGSAAEVMPAGMTPSGTAGTGSVTLSWPAVTLPDGAAVGGYLIQRYNAINGTLSTVGGTCAGVVTVTTCTDQSAPSGSWIYTDTPVLNNWHGPASPSSGSVSVN